MDKTEEEFIDEMKAVIMDNTQIVSQKVIKSALRHMLNKEWVNIENFNEVEIFFAQKIPKVLSQEIAKKLNGVLGLDLKL